MPKPQQQQMHQLQQDTAADAAWVPPTSSADATRARQHQQQQVQKDAASNPFLHSSNSPDQADDVLVLDPSDAAAQANTTRTDKASSPATAAAAAGTPPQPQQPQQSQQSQQLLPGDAQLHHAAYNPFLSPITEMDTASKMCSPLPALTAPLMSPAAQDPSIMVSPLELETASPATAEGYHIPAQSQQAERNIKTPTLLLSEHYQETSDVMMSSPDLQEAASGYAMAQEDAMAAGAPQQHHFTPHMPPASAFSAAAAGSSHMPQVSIRLAF